MLTLTWIKSTTDVWLPLKFNLESATKTVGCYIIWHGGQKPRVGRVGQGKIPGRIGDHGNDSEVLAYAANGPLMVTWATVPASDLDGVERYLADTLKPLIGDRFPDVAPIPVNLPWAA